MKSNITTEDFVARELAKCNRMKNEMNKDKAKLTTLRTELADQGFSEKVKETRDHMTNCINDMMDQDQQQDDSQNSINEIAEEVKESSLNE